MKNSEWMNMRCGKFTASEIHKLFQSGKAKDEYFGKDAMTYIRTKLAEILTGEIVELPDSLKALEWGREWEEAAVKYFSDTIGCEVVYLGSQNPEFYEYGDYSGGSPDGLTYDNGIIEVKCPYTSHTHISYLMLADVKAFKKECPKYYAQIQMNLLCTERTYAYFISYDPRMIDKSQRLKVIKIDYDVFFVAELKERIEKAEEILKAMYEKVTIKEAA